MKNQRIDWIVCGALNVAMLAAFLFFLNFLLKQPLLTKMANYNFSPFSFAWTLAILITMALVGVIAVLGRLTHVAISARLISPVLALFLILCSGDMLMSHQTGKIIISIMVFFSGILIVFMVGERRNALLSSNILVSQFIFTYISITASLFLK